MLNRTAIPCRPYRAVQFASCLIPGFHPGLFSCPPYGRFDLLPWPNRSWPVPKCEGPGYPPLQVESENQAVEVLATRSGALLLRLPLRRGLLGLLRPIQRRTE